MRGCHTRASFALSLPPIAHLAQPGGRIVGEGREDDCDLALLQRREHPAAPAGRPSLPPPLVPALRPPSQREPRAAPPAPGPHGRQPAGLRAFWRRPAARGARPGMAGARRRGVLRVLRVLGGGHGARGTGRGWGGGAPGGRGGAASCWGGFEARAVTGGRVRRPGPLFSARSPTARSVVSVFFLGSVDRCNLSLSLLIDNRVPVIPNNTDELPPVWLDR